jgi:hypothetical protein
MIEPGTHELEVIYDKATIAELYACMGDGNLYDFAEKYTDGAGWTYSGYFKKLSVETKTEDEANKATIGIKVTTKPAFVTALTVTTES